MWDFAKMAQDVLSKATSEMEKNIDNTLGIDADKSGLGSNLTVGSTPPSASPPSTSPAASPVPEAHLAASATWTSPSTTTANGNGIGTVSNVSAVPAVVDKASSSTPAAGTSIGDGPADPAAPAAKPKKTIVRKVVKKVMVPKGTLAAAAAAAAAATSCGAAAADAACDGASSSSSTMPSQATGKVGTNLALHTNDRTNVPTTQTITDTVVDAGHPSPAMTPAPLPSTPLHVELNTAALSDLLCNGHSSSTSVHGSQTGSPDALPASTTAVAGVNPLIDTIPADSGGSSTEPIMPVTNSEPAGHSLSPPHNSGEPHAVAELSSTDAGISLDAPTSNGHARLPLESSAMDSSTAAGVDSSVHSSTVASHGIDLSQQAASASDAAGHGPVSQPSATATSAPEGDSSTSGRIRSPELSPSGADAPRRDGQTNGRTGHISSGGILPELASSPSINTTGLDREELLLLVQQLSDVASEREQQLLRQATQMSDLQQVIAKLQDRNEQLALQSSKVSEHDLEELRAEFESRLASADRKVYALSKERDALRKGSEKLADYGATIRDKEEHIKQLMGEGDKLSKKHAELEGLLRKVRSQAADTAADRDRLASRMAAEEAGAEALRKAKAKAERDMAAAEVAAKAELEAVKEQYEALLLKAKADQHDAEERARDTAAAGLARRVKEAEGRSEALAESVAELRDALDRQRQAADLREEMLQADISDLERRSQTAELRHQELTAKLPDAMRPLLRQIEAMQAAAEAQSDAWSSAERMLNQRVSEAENRAASMAEKERLAVERTQVLHSKVQSLEGALAAARADVRAQSASVEAALSSAAEAREAAAELAHQVELLQERGRIMLAQMEQAAANAAEDLKAEREARLAAEADAEVVHKECERRLAAAAEEAAASGRRAPEPPAMAAPGYRWVLVKEGADPHSSAHHHRVSTAATNAEASLSIPLSHAPDSPTDSHFARDSNPGRFSQNGSSFYTPSSGAGGLSHHDGGTHGSSNDLLRSLVRSNSHAQHGPAGPLTAAEMESLRGALRQKQGEVQQLEASVRELQATRDRLAEELVSSSQKVEAAADALSEMERLRAEVADARARYTAAVELLGERDEQLEELSADLQDVKSLYKDQIEWCVLQLAALGQFPGGGAGRGVGHMSAAGEEGGASGHNTLDGAAAGTGASSVTGVGASVVSLVSELGAGLSTGSYRGSARSSVTGADTGPGT